MAGIWRDCERPEAPGWWPRWDLASSGEQRVTTVGRAGDGPRELDTVASSSRHRDQVEAVFLTLSSWAASRVQLPLWLLPREGKESILHHRRQGAVSSKHALCSQAGLGASQGLLSPWGGLRCQGRRWGSAGGRRASAGGVGWQGMGEEPRKATRGKTGP